MSGFALGSPDEARQPVAHPVAPGRVTDSMTDPIFVDVVTRKLAVPVAVDDAEAMVRQLAALPVVTIDSSLVVSAIAGSRECQIPICNALILRAAEVAGCRRVLSEDLVSAGTTYGSVVVENPFPITR